MRHLRKFDTQTNYNNVKSSLALPNMCLLNDTYKIASEGDEDIVPIEYLQSTGTQYIDTGVYGHMNHTYEINFNQIDTNNYRIWGVFGQQSYVGYNMSFTYGSSTWMVRWESTSNGQRNIGLGSINTQKHNIKISNGQIYFDNLDKGITDGHNSNFVINFNLFLFTINPANNTPSSNAKVRIYSYKDIDENGNLIRDFIPVRIGNVGYMFDKVSKKLFGNSGTGNFTLGADVDSLKFKNVITNGYGEMLNNYNFSGFTFDSSDCPSGCSGSFVCNTKTSKYTNEYIPLRRGSTLKLKYWVKNTTSCTNYDFIAQYDSDKNEITYDNWHWVPGSTTYLTQPLNNGDTVVHLANVSVYKTTKDTSKGFIIWNYKNSAGYEYPKETYSRNRYTSLWNNASTDINTTNNTITLKTAWNKGNIPAGTFISHYQAGNTYHYGNIGYKTTVDTWVEKSATFNTTTANSLSKGTAYIKIGWLINYSNVSGNIFKVSGVRLVQEKHI